MISTLFLSVDTSIYGFIRRRTRLGRWESRRRVVWLMYVDEVIMTPSTTQVYRHQWDYQQEASNRNPDSDDDACGCAQIIVVIT